MTARRQEAAARRCIQRWLAAGITPSIRARQVVVWPADESTLERARVIAVGVDRAALKRLIRAGLLVANSIIAAAASSSAQHLVDARVHSHVCQQPKGTRS